MVLPVREVQEYMEMNDRIVRFSVETRIIFDRNLGTFVPAKKFEVLAKCSVCGIIYSVRFLHKCRKKSAPDSSRRTEKQKNIAIKL